jgi:hypothetical protein
VSTLVPPLFAGLVDDASLLPPGIIGFDETRQAHAKHRKAWYSGLIGALLVPASVADPDLSLTGLTVGVINDSAIGQLPAVVAKLRAAGAEVSRVEAAVARRGEDPQPGLGALEVLAAEAPDLDVYAEIPLSWGLLAGLDTVAAQRARGRRIAAKFRVGGLAAELFPTPVELAAVICACRDRDLPFKFAAGLRHALRHTDPETGFTHHGFLNVLVASVAASGGGEVTDVAEALAATHPVPLVEPARVHRDQPRPLWAGFGTSNVLEPLTELIRLGLINGGYE